MKKLSLGLALIVLGNAIPTLAFARDCNCDIAMPNYRGGFILEVDGLYQRSSSFNNYFAADFGSITGTSDASELLNVDKNDRYKFGYRIGVGYAFPCTTNDAMLAFMHYNNNRGRSFDGVPSGFAAPFEFPVTFLPVSEDMDTIAFITTPGTNFGDLGPGFLLTLNLNFLNSLPNTTSLSSEIRENVVDLEFGHQVRFGCLKVRFYAGGRYANLENNLTLSTIVNGSVDDATLVQSFPISYVTTETPGGLPTSPVLESTLTFTETADVAADIQAFYHDKTKFDGVGPRFGIDATYPLGCSGLSFVGSVSTAGLVGERRHNVDFSVTGTETIAITALDVTDSPAIPGFIGGVPVDATPDSPLVVTLPASPIIGTSKSDHRTRFVPNLDWRLGLEYTINRCNTQYKVEAGYLMTYYFNAFDNSDLVVNNSSSNTSFDGPYLGLKVLL